MSSTRSATATWKGVRTAPPQACVSTPCAGASRGNKYLLVIVDRFTKLVRTVPLKGISASEVARAFVTHWVFSYGPPADLIADNGRQFTSRFFLDVCRILNVHNAFTTTYHPQTNGQVERFNRTILSALRTYIGDHPKDWDLYSSAITFAYNCQPQSSTDIAPFDLVLSLPPGPLALEVSRSEPSSTTDFKTKWKAWLEKALTETRAKLKAAQDRYKRNYDRRLRRDNETIKPEDSVYLRVERRDEAETRHKLAPIAKGPYRVKAVDNRSKTVVIEYDDHSVENVSRSRVVLAPKRITPQELQESTRPSLITETIPDYPASEETNRQHVEEEIHAQPDNFGSGKDTPPGEGNNPPKALESNDDMSISDVTQDEIQIETDKFFIERITDHKINRYKRRENAKPGELLYKVHWLSLIHI